MPDGRTDRLGADPDRDVEVSSASGSRPVGVVLAAAVFGAAAAVVVGFLLDRGDDDSAQETLPSVVIHDVDDAAPATTSDPRGESLHDQRNLVQFTYFDPPARGAVDRFVALPGHRPDSVFLLGASGPDGRGAVLLADSTRRAVVRQAGSVSFEEFADVPVRVLRGADGTSTRLEWDEDGYGWFLLATGLTDTELVRLAGTIEVPLGATLLSGIAPNWSPRAVGLEPALTRSGPAAVVGAPLLGQGALSGVEGLHYYAPGEGPAGSFALLASRDRVVRAADLLIVLGRRLRTARLPAAGGEAVVVVLDFDTDQLVLSRMTGRARILWDTSRGLTFELSSDDLTADELLGVAVTLDEDLVLAALAPPGG